jgi:hypothetical protein
MVEATTDLKAAEDEKILECWERPSSCYGVASRPKSNGNSSNTRFRSPISRQQLRGRGQIARFLHNHKDDGAQTTQTMPRHVVM